MKKIIVIFLVSFLLSGCDAIRVTQAQTTIEAGVPFKVEELLDFDQEKLVVTTDIGATINRLGETTLVFEASKVSDSERKETFEFSFDVVDTTPPTIQVEKPLLVYQDMPINVLDHIRVYDNVDTIAVESVIVSEFSTSIIGNHSIEVQVSDSSNNEHISNLDLEVIARSTIDDVYFRVEPMYGMGWGFYAPFIDAMNKQLVVQMTFENNDPGYDVIWSEVGQFSLSTSFSTSQEVQFIDSTFILIPLEYLSSNPETIYITIKTQVNNQSEDILITFLNLNLNS